MNQAVRKTWRVSGLLEFYTKQAPNRPGSEALPVPKPPKFSSICLNLKNNMFNLLWDAYSQAPLEVLCVYAEIKVDLSLGRAVSPPTLNTRCHLLRIKNVNNCQKKNKQRVRQQVTNQQSQGVKLGVKTKNDFLENCSALQSGTTGYDAVMHQL